MAFRRGSLPYPSTFVIDQTTGDVLSPNKPVLPREGLKVGLLRASHWLAVLMAFVISGTTALGDQPHKFRPYVQMRSGEFNTVWGVQDMWAFSVGADLNRFLSVELAFDSYEKDFDPMGTKIGEQSLLSLVPQVRLRYPVLNDRIVPYAILGAGLGWYDYNDPTQAGYGFNVDAQGNKLVLSAGLGADFFLNEYVAFNLETKYIWMDQLDISVNGTPGTFNMSDFVFTFGFRAYMYDSKSRPLLTTLDKPPTRLYFGAAVGGAVIADGDWIPGVELVPESASAGTIGQSVGLALGADFGRHFGVEVAADYFEGVIRLDNLAGVTGGVGEYATYAVIPNLRLRLPLNNGRIVPYLLTGFGVTYGEVNDRYENGSGVTVDSKGFAPAISVGGGVEYFFNRGVSIFGQVKWIHSWGNKIEVAGMGEQTGDLSWLHFQLGFKLSLAELGGSKGD